MVKRKKLDGGRPWLLGTEDRPPPMRVPWQMWSRSSDPHQQGLIHFEFTEEGLAVGWFPEGIIGDQSVIPWHELAWMAGEKTPDLKKEIEWIKEQAQAEGYQLARGMVLHKVSEVIAEEPSNPFLTKYAVKLKKAIDEVKKL
jgi:hypothetical protein